MGAPPSTVVQLSQADVSAVFPVGFLTCGGHVRQQLSATGHMWPNDNSLPGDWPPGHTTPARMPAPGTGRRRQNGCPDSDGVGIPAAISHRRTWLVLSVVMAHAPSSRQTSMARGSLAVQTIQFSGVSAIRLGRSGG